MLTHENAMSVCRVAEELEFIAPHETVYLYLPLAHVFAIITQLGAFDHRHHDRVFRRGHQEDPRGDHGDPSDVPAVGAEDLREALYGGDEDAGASLG